MTPLKESCESCRHETKRAWEKPCRNCKENVPLSDPYYDYAPVLWEAKSTDNPVTHPSHYNQGNIECIDAMVAAFGNEATAIFCHINAFKYLWRTEHKNGLQDIDKAIWYLNKYKELKASGE
jgi:hypothetical protein